MEINFHIILITNNEFNGVCLLSMLPNGPPILAIPEGNETDPPSPEPGKSVEERFFHYTPY